MSFEEFMEYMKEKVTNQTGKKVEIKKVTKNNSCVYHGLVIIDDKYNVAPTIYLEEFHEAYMQGADLEEVLLQIINTYEEFKPDSSYDVSGFEDFEKMKGKIVYKLVNAEANKEFLYTVPHERVLNLAKVYYLLLAVGERDASTITIRNEHIKRWGVTEKEVKEAAEENTERLLPVRMDSMNNIVEKNMKENPWENTEIPMFILSNQYILNGAAVIMYHNILKVVAEEMNADLYILPSSVHEVIIVPLKDIEADYFKEMVPEINRSIVAEEIILSDNVYIYRRNTDTIEIA